MLTPQRGRQLPPADLGLDVTIALAALTIPGDIFVCVSDRMISFGDITPADDNAAFKIFAFHPNWIALYAANDASVARPFLDEMRGRLSGPAFSATEVQDAFVATYTSFIQRSFLQTRLMKLGYSSVEQFRKEGRADLGDYFFELSRELNAAYFGIQFIVCGFDKQKQPRMFEVDDPGVVSDRQLLGYSVIGSGYHMGISSLRRRTMNRFLESTLYRLLEAKFSAETASGVGKNTTALLFGRDSYELLRDENILRIRVIWEQTIREPDPEEALLAIEKMPAIRKMAEGR